MLPIRGPISRFRGGPPTDLGTLVQWNNGSTNCALSNGTGKYAGLGNNVVDATGSTGYVSFAFSMLLQAGKKYYWEFVIQNTPSGTQTPVCGITAASPTSGVFPGAASNTTDFGVYAQSTSAVILQTGGSQISNMSGYSGSGSIVMLAWDMPNGNMWYGLNGTWHGGNPATGGTPDKSSLNTSTQRGLAFSGFNGGDQVCIATRASAMTYMNTLMGSTVGWNTPGS